MLTIRVPLKQAEKLKKYLLNNGLFNKEYGIIKDKKFVYFPISKKKDLKKKYPFIEFVNKKLKKTHKVTITGLLKDKLTKKELTLLPSSFDVIGDIIILELKEDLTKKEKLIAETLLKLHKNIKTVVKKIGIHKGVYRTQKLKVLAGINKKETIYKENNVKIKLDVEKVYFSPRLSSERKRIMNLVNPNESILVMFSGCGPYPLVLSKNTKVKEIYGVEINPTAHNYALGNIKLNKLKNVKLFCGDVNDLLPNLGHEMIALKSRCSRERLAPKLKHNPGIIEIYIPNGIIESNKKIGYMDRAIKRLSRGNIKVIVHAPNYYKGKELSLSFNPEKSSHIIECMERVNILAKNNPNVIGYIFHSDYLKNNNEDYQEGWLLKNLKKIKDKGFLRYLFLENGLHNSFGTKESTLRVIKKSKLEHMCFDFAHFMITNKRLAVKDYKDILSKIDVYTHIVNYKFNSGEHCCRLREGDIDIKDFAEYIERGCVEVFSKSEVEAKEQIEDWKYFLSIKPRKKFDRIIMPLPKSAGDFLELALKSVKKGGVIHFYDFLKENEFEKANEKIKKACKKAKKKCKILNVVKCGQHAPRVFRICVDFRVS